MDTTDLVLQAKNGDQQAITELYNLSYKPAYAVAFKMTGNEDDAFDILQDAYIKAFSSLDQLSDPSGFIPWFNKITANKCRDFLRGKKNVVLFSDMTYDSDEDSIELEFKDESTSFQPEERADYSDTKRLVAEMLDNLPADQKMVLLMYYVQEMPIKEIAEALEISENTVKSRMNYGKKKMRAQAEDMEKKGYKLRVSSITVIPFLIWMLRGFAGNVVLQPMSAAIGTAATAAAGTAAGTTAGAAAGAAKASGSGFFAAFKASLAAKITAGVVAAGVAVGGTVAVVKIAQEPKTVWHRDLNSINYTAENVSGDLNDPYDIMYFSLPKEWEKHGKIRANYTEHVKEPPTEPPVEYHNDDEGWGSSGSSSSGIIRYEQRELCFYCESAVVLRLSIINPYDYKQELFGTPIIYNDTWLVCNSTDIISSAYSYNLHSQDYSEADYQALADTVDEILDSLEFKEGETRRYAEDPNIPTMPTAAVFEYGYE